VNNSINRLGPDTFRSTRAGLKSNVHSASFSARLKASPDTGRQFLPQLLRPCLGEILTDRRCSFEGDVTLQEHGGRASQACCFAV